MPRLAIGLLALTLAGLVPAGASDPALDDLAWGVTECDFVIVSIQVERSRVQSHLPPGFVAQGAGNALLPVGPGTIDVDAYDCEEGVGLSGPVAPFDYGSYYAAVFPPAALRVPGQGLYFVKWDVLVSDGPLRSRMQDVGIPAHDGDATVTVENGLVHAQMLFEDGGGFTLEGVAEPPADVGSLSYVEYTPLAGGGLARWIAHAHDVSYGRGAGVLRLAEGSWMRDVVGTDTVAVSFIAGTWNIGPGTLRAPI